MKLPILPLGILLLAASNAPADPLPLPAAPQVDARNYALIDPLSGQMLAAHDAEKQVPPASLTKLMTAYLTFQAISNGTLGLGQNVPVSVAAWKAGGSTMFLQPGLPVTVEQAIQGMVVVSGNDAAVAISEAIAGNMDSFVQMMNVTAGQLGMNESHFLNVDGLPMPSHLTSARDIGILTEAIIRKYPGYLHYFGEKTFTYNHVTQNNWNPLVFSDSTVTGMKTGHTDDAGYCLDATAVRGGHRLIAVVLGASSREASAKSAEALLDYGYRFFETHKAYNAGKPVGEIRNTKASPMQIQVGPLEDVWVTVPRGTYSSLKPSLELPSSISLPLKRGQAVGKLILSDGRRKVVEIPLVALTPVEKAGWLTHWWNAAKTML